MASLLDLQFPVLSKRSLIVLSCSDKYRASEKCLSQSWQCHLMDSSIGWDLVADYQYLKIFDGSRSQCRNSSIFKATLLDW